MSEKLWLVQRYESDNLGGRWVDIRREHGFDPAGVPWPAVDAGAAFHVAVIQNERERLNSTRYRVLPYEGGATFNIGLNVDALRHGGVES